MTLPVGSTAITDPNTPSHQMTVNADGSINSNTTVTPVANQRVSAQSGDFVAGSITDLATLVTNTADLLVDGDNLSTIATNTTGVATAANQTTGNTSLSSIATNTSTSATQNTTTATNTGNISTVEGATTDAAVVGDNNGTISAKLRGFVKILNDIWDSTNHLIAANIKQIGGQTPTLDNTTILATSMRVKTTVAGDTALTLGSATSANSVPVVVASDQGAMQVKRSTVAVYSLASTATSGSTQNSGDLTVGPYTEIAIDINTTAQSGTNPTLQLFYERKAADGIYYILWQSAVLTAAANTLSTSIGAGMAYNQSLGVTGRLRWVVGGSNTPTYTHSLNIQGK